MAKRSPVVDEADVEQFVGLFLKTGMKPTVPDDEFIALAYKAALAFAAPHSPGWRNEFARQVRRRVEWRLPRMKAPPSET